MKTCPHSSYTIDEVGKQQTRLITKVYSRLNAKKRAKKNSKAVNKSEDCQRGFRVTNLEKVVRNFELNIFFESIFLFYGINIFLCGKHTSLIFSLNFSLVCWFQIY